MTWLNPLELRDGADAARRDDRLLLLRQLSGRRAHLRLRRPLAIAALHFLARLEDVLLHALLAKPANHVLRHHELTGVEPRLWAAFDLRRDVVGDGTAGRRRLGGDRSATVGVHRNDTTLLETRQETGDRAYGTAPAGRRRLIGLPSRQLVLETSIKDLPPLTESLVAHALPLIRSAHCLRTRRRSSQTCIDRLIARLTSLPSCSQDLRRVALAGVDGVGHELIAVLLGPEPSLVAGASLRRGFCNSGTEIQRATACLGGVDTVSLEPILGGLSSLLKLRSDIRLRAARLILLTLW